MVLKGFEAKCMIDLSLAQFEHDFTLVTIKNALVSKQLRRVYVRFTDSSERTSVQHSDSQCQYNDRGKETGHFQKWTSLYNFY